jgi:tetratricopeptide (TPR) repeat protein
MIAAGKAARCVTAVGFLLATTVVLSGAQTPAPRFSARDLFVRGNQLYEAGEFEEAAGVYEEAARWGIVSPDLYYNLGNAHYKSGSPGRAVLMYERALRLAPRDDDIRTNLRLVRSLLRDKQFVEDPGWVERVAGWVFHRLNLRETLFLVSILYVLLAAVTIGFIFRETRFVARVYPGISLLSPGRILGLDKAQDFVLAIVTLAVLLTAAGGSALVKYRVESARKAAIVVEEEVPVYGGPDTDSTLQFKIHEGTRITTGETRPGWVRIRLPGDLEGWVASDAVERI